MGFTIVPNKGSRVVCVSGLHTAFLFGGDNVNVEQVATVLRDYHWMIKEIAKMRVEMDGTESFGVAQYGDVAAMPKAQGGVGDCVANEVLRRERKTKRIVKLEKKVSYIQNNLHLITDDREQAILDCILDGLSNVKTARHIGLSEKHIRTIKQGIAEKLSNENNENND